MPELTDPAEHPDIPPEGFDDEPGGNESEEFGGTTVNLPVPPEVQTPDGAPVNPETPQDVEPESEYGTYDPALVRGQTQDEPLRDEEGNPLPAFDERCKDDFEGLAYLGALTKPFTWLGHRFVVRTLGVDELLAVTLVTQEYDQTMGQGLAYRTAMAALSVVSVDGKELPIPIGVEEDLNAWAHQRFAYARSTWFQFTVEAIYTHYLELEQKATAVVVAMGKALGQPASTTG